MIVRCRLIEHMLTLTIARAVLVACCRSEEAPLVTFSGP